MFFLLLYIYFERMIGYPGRGVTRAAVNKGGGWFDWLFDSDDSDDNDDSDDELKLFLTKK